MRRFFRASEKGRRVCDQRLEMESMLARTAPVGPIPTLQYNSTAEHRTLGRGSRRGAGQPPLDHRRPTMLGRDGRVDIPLPLTGSMRAATGPALVAGDGGAAAAPAVADSTMYTIPKMGKKKKKLQSTELPSPTATRRRGSMVRRTTGGGGLTRCLAAASAAEEHLLP